jgi:hypothetical protein
MEVLLFLADVVAMIFLVYGSLRQEKKTKKNA